jgi:TPR repeat protein
LSLDAPTAFFSYSRDDSEFALRLAEDLKSAGAYVWLDQLDIQPGQRWARAVQDALNNAQRVLVILSPSSVESSNVEDEVTFALEEGKSVIPVFYRDCKVPLQLRPFQYVDFRTDYDRGLAVMLRTLGAPSGSRTNTGNEQSAGIESGASAARAPRPPGREDTSGRQFPHRQKRPGAFAGLASLKIPLISLLLLILAALAYFSIAKRQKPNQASDPSNILTSNPLPSDAGPKLRDLYQRATAGDSQAMVELGFAFGRGEGVPQSDRHATAFIRKAAEAGNAQGMAEFGWSLKNGRGIEQNYGEAVSWFRRSAEAGSAIGMDNLGVMYLNGDGVPPDFDQAFLWLRKAADAGNPDAMANLGFMYLTGKGTQTDYKQGENWSRKAITAGEPAGMANLGVMYEQGLGGRKDLGQAIDWYQKAAKLGNQYAIEALKRLQTSQASAPANPAPAAKQAHQKD